MIALEILKRASVIVLIGFGLALAAGDRTIEPFQPTLTNPIVNPNFQYFGTGQIRFLQINVPTYAVLGEVGMPISFTYISPNGAAKGIRFTPILGGSSVLINLSKLEVRSQTDFPDATPMYFNNFYLNATDFGPNPGENVAYRAVLIGQDGQEGEPIVLALNFRSTRDFQEDPRIKLVRERASEALEDVVAIGLYQALGESSLSVYSIESFKTYSRARVALRLPKGYNLGWNIQLIQEALEAGKVTGSDDTGQAYKISMGNDTRSVPGINALEFSLIMTPRLSANAKRGTITVSPIPDRIINGVKYGVDEPFRSGFTLNLEVKPQNSSNLRL
jgi:hypothetical protein